MSVSTEVQRTLVKSPPELWEELSNPEALGRHLGELGEIRITQVEPETKIEWEADGATGVVELEQSGWGTRVTLSLTRELPAEEQPKPGPDAQPESANAEPAPIAPVESGPEPVAALEPDQEPTPSEREPIAEPEPPPLDVGPKPIVILHPDPSSASDFAPAPETRPGFFARLFRRRRIDPIEAPALLPAEAAPELVALAAPEPAYREPPPPPPPPPPVVEPPPDLASELAEVEAQMGHEAGELLTGVLDRLGAAHHRPFSRG
jgi:hypothetical protein